MLLYSLICRGLSELFPSHAQLSQAFIFPNPTYLDEYLSVDLQVSKIDPKTDLNVITANVLKPSGDIGCESITQLTSQPNPFNRDAHHLEHEECETNGGVSHKGLEVGIRSVHERNFSKSDFKQYLDLSGDRNSLYTDQDFTEKKGFRGLLVPAPLLAGMFSYLLGTKLPGRGTNWLKLHLRYLSPAYLDEQISAQVCITRIRPEKELVNLQLKSMNSENKIICLGEALVLVSDLNMS
jgi:acyl dehydratase